VNLEELRSVQRAERESSQLQHLRDSFYRDVAAFVEGRKEDYRQRMAEAEDPFAASADVDHIKDEVESAQDVAEAVYERRVGKVVKMAAFAAAGMSTDEDGMTSEERALFEDLVARIERNRGEVLATLGGEAGAAGGETAVTPGEADVPDAAVGAGGTGPPADAGPDPGGEPGPGVLSDAMGGDDGTDAAARGPDAGTGTASPTGEEAPSPTEATGDPAPPPEQPSDDDPPADEAPPAGPPRGDGGEPASTPGSDRSQTDGGGGRADEPPPVDDRVTVRITSDIGEILGVDQREYDLAREDVVMLPETNAGPLVDRGAAERLE
jgi:DNA replication factor GINS